ncbi:hypothetical protein TSOC_002517 [Tetrabaena socialis]|uniref:Uncharacterized protein n=1 Tax=Tetrabaena socialis TaxID=47790 RepID=A0A2J8ADY8_9CHLO|nr:hypothetical protein TSOC_002517 [Tetrabaena socialis]|eukprot:PNH10735.1 hypothetical protein TSOC_002517 [Tetrabaena socialis]
MAGPPSNRLIKALAQRTKRSIISVLLSKIRSEAAQQGWAVKRLGGAPLSVVPVARDRVVQPAWWRRTLKLSILDSTHTAVSPAV